MKIRFACGLLATLALALLAPTVFPQTLTGEELVAALREGGKVIVMRHASSPGQPPAAGSARPDNVNAERQLDDEGRADAAAMGEALRRLEIPIISVISSPTYRAQETARLAGFSDIVLQSELSNEGMRDSAAVNVAWLQTQVAVPPVDGNRLLITHGPNINAAFPDLAAGMEEGEALVFDAGAEEGAELVARIKISEWPELP